MDINNSYDPAVNKTMNEFGREVFWIVTIILLFILGGWIGKICPRLWTTTLFFVIPKVINLLGGNVFKLYVLAIK